MSDGLFQVKVLRRVRKRDGSIYQKREVRRAYSPDLESAIRGFQQSAAYLGMTLLGDVEEVKQ